ncbi:autotransporter-associated beta strand repeat-containing protein [Desulfovibrio sp. OttesenSCG-928-O18]|nr:autotransporter-associated beta strand repeat-containing protein [Desulfovibrio sp. OttesenSCG-928-O18]
MDASSGTNDILRLGGDTSPTNAFDVSKITSTATAGATDEYVGFSLYEKTGASTWTLTGTDANNRSWTVKAGTLKGNTDTFKANQTVNAGASIEFAQSAAGTYSNVISGDGSLIKSGTGVLTLSGANTYTGATTVTGGTLALSGAGTLGTTSALTLYDNTGFNFSASNVTLPQLNVYGGGASINTGGNSLDLNGGSLNFLVPSTAVSGTALLSVTGDADIGGASVTMGYQSVRPSIAVGQSLTLLSATSLTADQAGLTVQTASGDIYSLLVDNNQLLAMLDFIAPTTPAYERLKAYAEGRAATLAFVNQGQELIINQGFGSALAATAGPGFRMNAFGGMGGGKSRYNTGSHVDVEGFSMLAGLALGNDVGLGRLTLGAFFEAGWGSYDSHNSFSNYASVNGDGDTSYYGGGILGRYDLTSGALSGLYFDASARMGRAKMDFDSGDIKYNGSSADFDSSSLYYGLHGGLGYVWSINEAASLDLSAKLLWTRQESDSVSVRGDNVRFKDADSLRTRLGGRFAYAVSEYVTPYVGAYWEHEFDGKIRSTVNSNGIDAPKLEGDTGMGELGLSFKPVTDSGLSFDLGVQGYTGQREGVTGSFQIKFEF